MKNIHVVVAYKHDDGRISTGVLTIKTEYDNLASIFNDGHCISAMICDTKAKAYEISYAWYDAYNRQKGE